MVKLVQCHLRKWNEFRVRTFPAPDDSNIFDRIIAQFRTTPSRGDEDEDDAETMRGLQDLLLPVIQSHRCARTRQRGAFSHGNIDAAPHSSRINRPKRVALDGLADRTSFRMMRFSAGCQGESRFPWPPYKRRHFNI